MKFWIKSCLLLLLCAWGLSACKNSNSPQSVTERFLTAVAQLDIKTAKNLSTKQTWNILDILQKETKNYPEDEKLNLTKDFKIKILKVNKINDSMVRIGFETTPPLFTFPEMPLVRSIDIEGREKWKVDISTFDLIKNDTIGEEMIPVDEDTLNTNQDAPKD